MNNLISSIMETDVYTCHQDASLVDVVKTLVELRISGLPIVDDNNHVVGFITDGDVMKAVGRRETRAIYGGDSSMVYYDTESMENKIKEFSSRNVMELATVNVISVSPDRPIDEVARILAKKKIKKMPIVNDKGELVGIVRRSTIMRYIFGLIFDIDVDKQEVEGNR